MDEITHIQDDSLNNNKYCDKITPHESSIYNVSGHAFIVFDSEATANYMISKSIDITTASIERYRSHTLTTFYT